MSDLSDLSDAIRCPVCAASGTRPFLDRPAVPVHQNLLMPSAQSARDIPRGRLLMHCCPTCSFVFNAAFDPSLLSYGSDYDNTQSASPSFDRYTDSLAQRILSAAPSSPSSTPLRIVEVGCGKGAFLRKLLSLHPTATGIGFDPTYVGPLSDLAGRLRFEQRFYDHHAAAHPADIVVCRHVIEHVPQPLLLLESVHAALAQSPSPLVCFETPDVTWILRHGVIWDFFYEHCSLFRPASITRAFQSAGFHVTGVHAVFGDQYMWTEAGRAAAPSPSNPPAHHSGGDIPAMCQQFARQEQQRLASWRHMIERYSQRGPVMIWGAGAKGVTLANLLDPGAAIFHAVVDINPAKQGRFLPGTGHRIIAPADLPPDGIVLVLNPNYVAEIRRDVAAIEPTIHVVDLMSEAESHP